MSVCALAMGHVWRPGTEARHVVSGNSRSLGATVCGCLCGSGGEVVVCGAEGPRRDVDSTLTSAPASTYKLKSAGCSNESRCTVGGTGRENERGQKEHVKVKAGEEA